ncbi:MAG: DNA internalization-related competence protein ComEC/Rec2 [Anaerolineae bacterium]|nr:DNA internalization-related competence protein ComEC/Rec2 [Anaerolineae bacterium]
MPPLLPVSLAWVGGLVIAHYWLVPLGVDPRSILCLCLIPLGGGLLYWRELSTRLAAVCALALLLGALRYQAALPDRNDPAFVAQYNDQGWATLEGTVREYPDERDQITYLVLDAEMVEREGDGHAVHGQVLVRAAPLPTYEYGDRLRVSGMLQTPPVWDDFDYRAHLERKKIYSYFYEARIEKVGEGEGNPLLAAIYQFKDRAAEGIARLVPDPEAALMQGIVLGIEGGIPQDLYDEFNATGTSHIIVISGSNIAIVSALFAALFGVLLGKRRAYWLTMGGILLYVILVGGDAAVARAGLMGGLYVTARRVGRRSMAYVSLGAAAVVLTAITPPALWDTGFQLSFAATLSLCLFTPPLERRLRGALERWLDPERGQQVARLIGEALVATVAAQVLVLPLVAYHFHRLSLVSPLANLLIVPAQPPIMTVGSAAVVLAAVPGLEPAAQVVAWIPWLCLGYTVAVVRGLAAWPGASIALPAFDGRWLMAYYGGVAASAWGWSWLRRARLGLPRPGALLRPVQNTLLALAVVGAVLAWIAVMQLPDRKLHVAFLDVGQGDAILITAPDGRQVLVDGGPSPAALTTALGREMPFWDRSLDLVVMTHPDGDHITGLVEVLERYRVAGWLDNGRPAVDDLHAVCEARRTAAGVPRAAVAAGDRIDLGNGVAIDVLGPPAGGLGAGQDADNEHSVMLRVSWGAASFLLTGDAGAQAEAALLRSGRPLGAAVLKVAHHGSGGSTSAAFLDAVGPKFAVISVGEGNWFGHPSDELLERLQTQGVTVLRTDQVGTVEFVTDGERVWVETDGR